MSQERIYRYVREDGSGGEITIDPAYPTKEKLLVCRALGQPAPALLPPERVAAILAGPKYSEDGEPYGPEVPGMQFVRLLPRATRTLYDECLEIFRLIGTENDPSKLSPLKQEILGVWEAFVGPVTTGQIAEPDEAHASVSDGLQLMKRKILGENR